LWSEFLPERSKRWAGVKASNVLEELKTYPLFIDDQPVLTITGLKQKPDQF